jgi:hypothetical protein
MVARNAEEESSPDSCLMQDEPEAGTGFSYKMSLKASSARCWELIISMDDSEARSLEQIQAFLAGSAPVQFAGQGRGEVYAWAEKTLVRHEYASLGKAGKVLVRRYMAQMTGLSRAQLTRLIRLSQSRSQAASGRSAKSDPG